MAGASAFAGIAVATQAHAAPQPVNGATVVVEPLKGKVLVKNTRSGKTHQLRGVEKLRLKGSVVDTRRGRVKLTAKGRAVDGLQIARIWGSRFRATQSRNSSLVRLRLVHDLSYQGCSRPGSSRLGGVWGGGGKSDSGGEAEVLWVDARGEFGTSGSAGRFETGFATSDSAEWFTRDRCYSTRYQVQRGEVELDHPESSVSIPTLGAGEGATVTSYPCFPSNRPRCFIRG